MFAAHAHAQSPSSGIANSGLSSNPPSTNDFVNRALSTLGNGPACAQFNGPTECAGMSGVFSFGAADGARVVQRRTPLCIDECDSPLAWPPGRSTPPKPGGGTPLGVPGLTAKARTKQPCCSGAVRPVQLGHVLSGRDDAVVRVGPQMQAWRLPRACGGNQLPDRDVYG
jgi:hypothetical protein